MKAKNKIRRQGFGFKLSGNILAKFELNKLKTALNFLENKFRKKGKIDEETFCRPDEIKQAPGCQDNYLRFDRWEAH